MIRARAASIAKDGQSRFLRFAFASMAIAIWALPLAAQENLITSHGISPFGNLNLAADYDHLPYVNPDAPKGGEISTWAPGSFDSMNPYSTKGRAGALSSIMYERLLDSTADELDAVYGWVAKSLTYPEDRSWVIFDLRPEARFSDGSPLTASDIAFSYELLLEKGLPSFRAQLAQKVESAEVLAPDQVKFTFKEGIPTRDLPSLVGSLPIFSQVHYETAGLDLEESSMIPIMGSGPYIVGEIDTGQSITYHRNPDYWGADLPINRGRHNFDRIRVEYYADYQAAFEGFKGGSYTFRSEASSKIWATAYDFPAIENGWIVKDELANGNIPPGQSFVFNLRRPQFQDRRVRQAIGLMFNFEWSNETLFYGIYDRGDSFWENSDRAATGLPSEEELALLTPLAADLPPGVLDGQVSAVTTSGTRQLDRRNLRKASRLLDDAGWIVGDDGMRRNAEGDILTIEFLNDSQTFDRVLNPYVENLRALGVDAVHNRVDNAQAVNRERNFDFDFVTAHFPMSNVPGGGLEQYFGSDSWEVSLFNKAGVHSPAIDALIEHVKAAKSEDELRIAVRALDRVLRAEYFRVPQWYKGAHTVAYYDMFEYPENLPPYDLGYLDFWWYNPERAAELDAAGAFQ